MSAKRPTPQTKKQRHRVGTARCAKSQGLVPERESFAPGWEIETGLTPFKREPYAVLRCLVEGHLPLEAPMDLGQATRLARALIEFADASMRHQISAALERAPGPSSGGYFEVSVPGRDCVRCSGTGRTPYTTHRCQRCKGTGNEPGSKTTYHRIRRPL